MKLICKYFSVIIFLIFLAACDRDEITNPGDDNIPPNTPIGLNVFGASDGEVGIEWIKNQESNVTGYKIFRSVNNSNNFQYIGITSDNFYIDDSLDYDSTYYYSIKAVNRAGKESGFSEFVSAQPKNIYSPGPPIDVAATAKNSRDKILIKLSWRKPYDSDIKGFEIYRSTTENFKTDTTTFLEFVPPGNIPYFDSYTDTSGIEILTRYYYKIKCVDKGDLKSYSSFEVSDLVLDEPELVSPTDKAVLNNLGEFKIITAGAEAVYKLIVQTNEIYGTVAEIEFESSKIHEENTIAARNLILNTNKTYYWRVFTYTNNNDEPNSYSGFFSFTLFSQ
ncbi:MAG: hypothetical protein HYS25_04265 [Ignavibacteriales bacterium]|nr:hypothetical protein [Ignavibacteriales bacterium]